ncbi:serine/threonine-protein kinase GA29083 isoform X2 [Frankliniella occidentalis]|uniref:non-specific serine/threonine protein kinase n=1 Tax=Frankliniella occidentalis TaxID=133901 RepID=A0A9C6UE58_FRAOC|nr:serine/threonine-protein kinase GA29083 isoform X2 [Frankliniella occidentalis]
MMSNTLALSPSSPTDLPIGEPTAADDALSSDGSNAMETHISFHPTTEELEEDDFKENCSSRTLVARNQAKKAKRVRFLRNGDRFFKGVVMPVAAERYRSFDSLLSDLTRALEHSVTLPSGVRTIYTMDGRKVQSIDQLDDGKEYLCSGPGETFKRVDYSNNNGTLGKKKPNAVPGGGDRPRSGGTSRSGIPEFVRPRILTLVRNGTRPRKVVRLLINRRNAPSMDHVLSCITEAVKLDTGAARKVFSQSGVQVTQFEEFFGEDDVFFVYGSERYSQEDFELDEEEYKSIQSQRKGAMWNRGGNGGIMPKMPGKTKAAKSQSEAVSGTTDPNIPSAINTKYLVLETIGDGNFAQVRRCVDRSSGREFALKIIEKSRCRGKEHMIESEVDILRKVRHPNIVRLFAEHDEPEQLYLVMELVKGGDLFDAIATATKFNEWDSSIMIRNLASALCYLHSLSIVHRDIKPENLLVEVDGHGVHTLKVGDFGLAQKVTEPLFSVCGTPTYVAPEILAETGYGLKIDVWAAGVILYILLCGFPPFVSTTNDQEELFTRILAARFAFTSPYWDDISDSAKDLVAHMLQPVPELRLSAEDVLDHPWLALVELKCLESIVEEVYFMVIHRWGCKVLLVDSFSWFNFVASWVWNLYSKFARLFSL